MSKKTEAREGELLPRKLGKPSLYTEELAREICRLIAEEGLLVKPQICQMEGMPAFRTLRDWVNSKPEFAKMYNQALLERLDLYAEQMVQIADDGSNDYMEVETRAGRMIKTVDHEHIARAKLRIDTRKWLMAVGNPHRYSERLGTDGGPGAGLPAVIGNNIERTRRLMYLLHEARKLADEAP